MSRDYVEKKIQEALRLNDGNEAKTKRQVHAWLYEDHRFLLELTRPHIGGIVAYSVSRTKNKMLTAKQEKRPASPDEAAEMDAAKTANQGKKKREAGFGETMLRSFISDDAARFGYESSAPPVGKRIASQKHIDTMHLLAAASKKKAAEDHDGEKDNKEE